MVIANRKPNKVIQDCPHCGSNFVTWDGLEKEPYCFTCGWRRSLRISSEQARNRFSSERRFWLNLFAQEDDPDDPNNPLLYKMPPQPYTKNIT